MAVNRCVCHEVTFREISELAKRGLSFEQIKDQTGCSTGCGSCEWYARLAALTGTVDFPVLSEQALKELVGRAEASVIRR
ncbi:MAG: bacterioferritin-associated ferredoxin [Phycisphaerales bacterium]